MKIIGGVLVGSPFISFTGRKSLGEDSGKSDLIMYDEDAERAEPIPNPVRIDTRNTVVKKFLLTAPNLKPAYLKPILGC